MLDRLRDILWYFHVHPHMSHLYSFWLTLFLSFKAFIFAYLIQRIYQNQLRTTGPVYSNSVTFFPTVFGMAAVIMIIDQNIMGSFSLIGAISLIRFRVALKNSLDTATYFLCLVAGMAVATHMSWIVFLLLAVLSLTFAALDRGIFARLNQNTSVTELLNFSHSGTISELMSIIPAKFKPCLFDTASDGRNKRTRIMICRKETEFNEARLLTEKSL